MATRACPCGSGLHESACCRPYLRGAEAPDAAALMRSRYTAFATGDVAYLVRTLAGAHAEGTAARDELVRSLKDTCRRVRFMGLRVLDHAAAGDDGFARVLFSVRAFEKGRDRSFHELSRFRHDGAGWRYVDGALRDGPAPEGATIATFIAG